MSVASVGVASAIQDGCNRLQFTPEPDCEVKSVSVASVGVAATIQDVVAAYDDTGSMTSSEYADFPSRAYCIQDLSPYCQGLCDPASASSHSQADSEDFLKPLKF